MNLESRKISFIQEFLRIQNEEVIRGLENLLKKQKAELNNKAEFKPMSLEQLEREIAISLEDSENDRGMTADELLLEIKKWN